MVKRSPSSVTLAAIFLDSHVCIPTLVENIVTAKIWFWDFYYKPLFGVPLLSQLMRNGKTMLHSSSLGWLGFTSVSRLFANISLFVVLCYNMLQKTNKLSLLIRRTVSFPKNMLPILIQIGKLRIPMITVLMSVKYDQDI